MPSSKISKLSPEELERENVRLLDETTKLESDVARWEAACKRAETTYYGEGNYEIIQTTITMPPCQTIQIDFDIADGKATFKDPNNP